MRQHVRSTLAALLLTSITTALAQGFDLATFLEYRGAPKEVIERSDNGNVKITNFAPEGNIATVLGITSDRVDTSTYVWDSTNQVLIYASMSVTQPNEPENRSIFGFDERGRKIYERGADPNRPYRFEYSYSANGSTETAWYYEDGSLTDTGEILYISDLDEHGRHVLNVYPNSRIPTIKSTYGPHGFLETSVLFYQPNEPIARHRYEYETDEYGN